jgi:protein-S-isoprenylcysteine O-methyltransferase Ste14
MYKGHLLVLCQFTLIITIIVSGDITQSSVRVIGVVLGLLLGAWAILVMRFKVSILPDPARVSTLYVRGPYRLIRHPMYTSVLMVTLSYSSSAVTGILWLLLLTVLIVKLRYEEVLLEARFKDYKAYIKKTKRLVPYIW